MAMSLWDKRVVRDSAVANTIKVWVWAASSLLLGLWLTPLAFNGGKALSELSRTKNFNGAVNRFAEWSGTAVMEDFFTFCWPLAALLLLLPLAEWLCPGNWSVAGNAEAIELSGETANNDLTGFIVAFVCSGLIAAAPGEGFRRDIALILAVAFLAEIFYSQVICGVFMEALKPVAAIALGAAMLAAIPMILSGFPNANGVDGETLSTLKLMGLVLGKGDVFVRFVIVFLPWFTFCSTLGWVRWNAGCGRALDTSYHFKRDVEAGD